MAKTDKNKNQELKLSQDENLKAFGSLADFQVHLVGYNEKGHRIEVREGKGPETLFVNHADWNKFRPYNEETLLNKARSIHAAIRMDSNKEKSFA